MRKLILPVAILSMSLFMFSFSTNEKKANYFEISKETKTLMIRGFTKYERCQFDSDKTEWNYRNQTSTLVNNGGGLSDIENALNKI